MRRIATIGGVRGALACVALAALSVLGACDVLPNDEETDLCASDAPPSDECAQCETPPYAAGCPRCVGALPDRDCENVRDGGADGGGGSAPLPLVDGQVPGGGGTSGADAGGTGGAGGAGGKDGGGAGTDAGACAQGCSGATPLCDEASNTCVGCRDDDDCGGAKPRCASATHTCVECTAHADCDGATPKCSDSYECVECLAHADCDDPAAAKCHTATHECVACTASSQCAHLSGKALCDDTDGECVACTGKDYASCGTAGGTPLVCDSLARACTAKKERSVGLCQACVSDAQCKLGQLCVMQEFGSPEEDVGHYCFWQKNAGVGGAPNDCVTARPFIDTLADMSSIDGTTATVCGLALTTCEGYNDYRNPSVNCEPSPNVPDDSFCGAAGLDDAYCRYFSDDSMGNNTYRCTTPCGSDDDCPCFGPSCSSGATCDKSGPNWMCNL